MSIMEVISLILVFLLGGKFDYFVHLSLFLISFLRWFSYPPFLILLEAQQFSQLGGHFVGFVCVFESCNKMIHLRSRPQGVCKRLINTKCTYITVIPYLKY